MKQLRVPEAEIVTSSSGYHYAWSVSGHGLMVLADSKIEAKTKYIQAIAEEYPRQYTYAGGILA
jgi:hypothetical protein